MPLSSLDHKKLYYYVICVMAFFVLMWGAIDLASSSIGLITIKSGPAVSNQVDQEEPVAPVEKGDQFFDSFYQKKMLNDRLWDALSRVIISSAIFIYCKKQVDKLEATS